jgi:pimeloyl-ACP methyl ester carboxylesterase
MCSASFDSLVISSLDPFSSFCITDVNMANTLTTFFNPAIGEDRNGPYQLFMKDVKNLMLKLHLGFLILWPLCTLRPLDELFLGSSTALALIWFLIWSILQAPIILFVFVVLIIVVIIIGRLTWIHSFLFWYILHGPALQVFPSTITQHTRNQYQHERWVYINGIATGRTIIRQNLQLLYNLFGRPVLGINNRTYGFLGDIVECVLQRSFGFRTSETRVAYPILEGFLNDANVTRVVLIAHSQGGIIASHVLRDLYTRVSITNLRKLEVYTFGNAALHFDNPPDPSVLWGRVLRYIEHYCNEHDMVCSWGALSSFRQQDIQFHGKIFISQGATGHLFNQHYLFRMFGAAGLPGNFLVQPAVAEAPENRIYWVPGNGRAGTQFGNIMAGSRLHQYLGGQLPA